LPLIQKIKEQKKEVQALIVAPTRELVVQICESLRMVASPLGIIILPIYGGVSMEGQLQSLKRGAHIIVGTPGRLNDHLRRKTLSLQNLKTLVLDEADIMLDMGFKEEVDEILSFAPENRQIWLFSATVKPGISAIMQQHMRQPVSVVVTKKNVTTHHTKQYFCVVHTRNRFQALCRFIDSTPEFYGFIFCQTKLLASEIAEKLAACGYNAAALHGDMGQAQRNAVIRNFRHKEYTILCATDVAARGIDIANLTHVINYSIPEDHESYVHRIGRTGRAGKEGVAITFINKSELRLISMLKTKFKVQIDPIDIPSTSTVIGVRLNRVRDYIENLDITKALKGEEQLKQLIETLSPNTLKEIAVHLLHEKFLRAVTFDEEIPCIPARQLVEETKPMQEILIHLGGDDTVTRADVTAYLTSSGLITEDAIRKIRIIKRRTFIEVPVEIAPKLVDALKGKKLCNKRARLTLVFDER
jgi:ATP-dependent RNA helicase DeaD